MDIWAMCLLVMVTIRGIPNPVQSLPSTEVTNRSCEERAHRWMVSCSWERTLKCHLSHKARCTARRHCEFCVAVERSSRDKSRDIFLHAWHVRFEHVEIILASVPAYDQWGSRREAHLFPIARSPDRPSTTSTAPTTEIEITEFLPYRLFHLANYVVKYPGKRIEISRVKKLRRSPSRESRRSEIIHLQFLSNWD